MAERTIWTVVVVTLCHLTVALGYQVIFVSPNCSQHENHLSLDDSLGQFCVDFDSVLDELESGMTLRLEPGVHVISRPHFNDTRGMVNVSIIGSGVSETLITCKKKLGLAFIGMEQLLFNDFTITGCGLTGEKLDFHLSLLEQSLDLFILVPLSTRVAMVMGDCKDVYMQDVHIANTTGLGLLGINIVGSSSFTGVRFTRNIRPRCLDSEPTLPAFITPDIYNQVGGGAYFLYSDYRNESEAIRNMSLYLIDCYFAHNADCTYMSVISVNFPFYTVGRQGLYEYAIGAGGGLSIVLANTNFEVGVTISNTTFYRNDARYGGGAYVASFAGFRHPVTVIFVECTFLENGVVGTDGVLQETYCRGGAGLALFTDLVKPEHFTRSIPSPGDINLIVGVIYSSFVRNEASIQGGGVMAYSFFSTPHANLNVRDIGHYSIIWYFLNVTFTENFARYSSAAYLTQFTDFGIGGSVWVLLEDLNVSNNYNQKTQNFFLSADEEASTIHMKEVTCIVLSSNTFSDNRGSALRIESTILTLSTNAALTFYQNLAHRGGALHFTGNSPSILVHPNTSLDFVNNQAVIEGGAIYFDPLQTPLEILQPLNNFGCFISTSLASGSSNPDGYFGLFSSNISISFTNNSAPLGGIVFRSSLEHCSWAVNIMRIDGLSLYQVLAGYNSTFSFSEEPTGQDLISTLPAKINVALLSNSSVAVFPGQAIKVGIQVLDVYGSVIPEVVTSVVNNRTIPVRSTLGNSGFWHTSVYESELRITGMYEGPIDISIVTETNSLSSMLSLNLTSCPVGFFIDPDKQQCVCDEALLDMSGVNCHEDSVSFSTFREVWIGINPGISNPDSSDLIVHHCLLNYCKMLGNNNINPPDFDTQCAFNRAGLLCGTCSEGYSAVFGTNECRRCSNYWLFLIPFFAIAGAVLFAGIALLEISIDKGLTNAALFFASLVSFFEFLSPNLYVFLPFRLLGLQLGVSTCFYDGMNSLHRCYLQFAFPIYLYVLMAIFTLLCRRFTWMSVHFSPSKTLVTLTMMCYLSILTTSLDTIVATRVESLGGDVSYRWIIDPTMLYFQGAHGFLATLGFVLLLFYIILFPLLLLFPTLAYRYLKRVSPFLDVIWDAYRPKLRFWFGIRVIVLAGLYLITRAPLVYAYIFSGVVIVLFFNIQTAIQPFKDKWANYIDAVLTTLITIYFWGAQAISKNDYTLPIKVLANLYISIFALAAYSIYGIMFCIHMHRRFPSLRPRLAKKFETVLRKRKSEDTTVVSRTVVEVNPDEPGNDQVDPVGARVTRSSVYVMQTSSPHPDPFSFRPSQMFVGSPQYRESLLGSIDPLELRPSVN